MTPREEVFENPMGWVARHVRSYVETDGRQGHRWNGVDTLLLTTRGRKFGKLRRTALIYGRDDDRYLVVASQGGAKKHPSWYLNLTENPEVEVQVGADKFTARALTAHPEGETQALAVDDLDLARVRPVSGQDQAGHPGSDPRATIFTPATHC